MDSKRVENIRRVHLSMYGYINCATPMTSGESVGMRRQLYMSSIRTDNTPTMNSKPAKSLNKQ
jgi:hypothetical protein